MASPSSTNSVALDSGRARHPASLVSARTLWVALAFTLLAVSWRFADVHPNVLFRPTTLAALWNFVVGLFPPDLSPDFLRTVLSAVLQTMATALIGTLLSIALALPLGVLATGTLWNRGVLVSAELGGLAQKTGSILSRLARGLLGFMRAVPDLVWALLFVAAVGLGPLAGTLALTVAYSGVLGRVYADVFEHVDPQPLEALQSTGATRLQIFLRGMWPQALPHLVAYSLYSFECCVRAAAVLGFVGAGGVGYEIGASMKLFEYGQVLTLLLVLIALLTATDATSRLLRRHFANNTNKKPSRIIGQEGRAPARLLQSRSMRFAVFVVVLVLLARSFSLAGFSSDAFASAGIAGRIADFARHMLPPDFRWAFLGGLGTALLETIAISLTGTLIGLALAALLALPATSTLVFLPGDSPGSTLLIERVLRWLLFWSARLVLNV